MSNVKITLKIGNVDTKKAEYILKKVRSKKNDLFDPTTEDFSATVTFLRNSIGRTINLHNLKCKEEESIDKETELFCYLFCLKLKYNGISLEQQRQE